MTNQIFVSHLFDSVLFVYFQGFWKSDDVFGHIYAEIEKILKDLKTFKQHCT